MPATFILFRDYLLVTLQGDGRVGVTQLSPCGSRISVLVAKGRGAYPAEGLEIDTALQLQGVNDCIVSSPVKAISLEGRRRRNVHFSEGQGGCVANRMWRV